MEWIRFEDMEPPIGLNIVVTSHERMAFIKWDRKFLKNNCESFDFMSNTWVTPNEIWELDLWAPVDYLNLEIPELDDNHYSPRLCEKYDWFARNKESHKFGLLKELIYKINHTDDESLQDTCVYSNGVKIKEYNGHKVHDVYLKQIDELFGAIGVKKSKED